MDLMQREKISQMRHNGFGYTKIAQALSLSVNTVKSYCKRNDLGIKPTPQQENICLNCNAPLLQEKGKKTKKFCSNSCRQSWWNSHIEIVKRKAVYKIICKNCGVEFESYGNKNRLYCNHGCYISYRFGDGGGQHE